MTRTPDPRATIFAARELGLTRILNWDTGVALNPVLHRGRYDSNDGTEQDVHRRVLVISTYLAVPI